MPGIVCFEDYLNIMTNPEMFRELNEERNVATRRDSEMTKRTSSTGEIHTRHSTTQNFHTPNKPDYKDCVMYEVMNKFFNSTGLGKHKKEKILDFYKTTMKHFTNNPKNQHAAHVVHHYADGARSLGLTEKEIKKQIDLIKENRRHEKNTQKKNSPYAKPMNLIPKIDKNTSYKKTYNEMIKSYKRERSHIWKGECIVNYRVDLPKIERPNEQKIKKKFQEYENMDNLNAIRRKTRKVYNEYRVKLSNQQTANNDNLWKTLRCQQITQHNKRLRDILKEVYGAYTKHVVLQPLSSKKRHVAYKLHDFSELFSDFSDTDDEQGV
jgi:hypothetical protein